MIKHLIYESLKIKRTMLIKLVYGVPILICIASLLTSSFYFVPNTFNWISCYFINILVSIFSIYMYNHEMKSTKFSYIRLLQKTEVFKNVLAKDIVQAILLLITLLLMGIITLILETILLESNYGIYPIFFSVISIWVTSLWQIPFQKKLIKKIGTLGTIIVNFLLGSIFGILAAKKVFWYLVPWTWTVRPLLTILNVDPNGTIIPVDNPYNSYWNVILPMLLSMILYTIQNAYIRNLQTKEV